MVPYSFILSTLILTLLRRKIIRGRSKVSLFLRETEGYTHSFNMQENFGEKGQKLLWPFWIKVPNPLFDDVDGAPYLNHSIPRGKNIQMIIFSILPKLVHNIGDVCQLLEA